MARIGDENDLHPLLVGLLHPSEDLIVENALARRWPDRDKAPEQKILVQPIGLIVTPFRLGLLAAVPGIGKHDGVAGLCLRHQSLPCGNDAVLACIVVDQAHHLFGAGPGQRFRDVVGIVGGAIEIVGGPDIVVDTDHEAVKFAGAGRRGDSRKEEESERSRKALATNPALAALMHWNNSPSYCSAPSGCFEPPSEVSPPLPSPSFSSSSSPFAFFFFGTASGSGGSDFR